MRLKFILAGAVCASFTATASAHPGSEILTTGSSKERSAMTQGMSFEEVNGVHLFRGSQAPASKVSRPAATTRSQVIRIEVAAPRFVWRSFRGLRRQGFYSGKAYPSRRYRRGFYSGR